MQKKEEIIGFFRSIDYTFITTDDGGKGFHANILPGSANIMTRKEAIGRMAKGIFLENDFGTRWELINNVIKNCYREYARAALNALLSKEK